MVAIREHFSSEGPGRDSEWARQKRWFIKARQDHQRREDIAEKVEDGVAALATAVTVAASQAQIKAFETKLDTYDTATVEALMNNQELIDAAKARLESLLDRAYVMPDGRRVFKTEDGTQVFDEFGEEVSPEELDPDLIGPERPTHEAFLAEVNGLKDLEAERADLLEYQDKLDAAREQIADGDISEADLEALDAELLEMMPETVRSHAGLEVAEASAEITPQKATPRTPSAEASTPAPAPL